MLYAAGFSDEADSSSTTVASARLFSPGSVASDNNKHGCYHKTHGADDDSNVVAVENRRGALSKKGSFATLKRSRSFFVRSRGGFPNLFGKKEQVDLLNHRAAIHRNTAQENSTTSDPLDILGFSNAHRPTVSALQSSRGGSVCVVQNNTASSSPSTKHSAILDTGAGVLALLEEISSSSCGSPSETTSSSLSNLRSFRKNSFDLSDRSLLFSWTDMYKESSPTCSKAVVFSSPPEPSSYVAWMSPMIDDSVNEATISSEWLISLPFASPNLNFIANATVDPCSPAGVYDV
eukprot:TRINITY_DN581_c0_g1_i1.p1 TRINITY_DN581_c0_g1~~TRINITY_DN581_c0_g1_i1.p1  ORF type:complete len:291 (-),score=11.22 TRINITY_DN581_c0_g1_i1:675-1547(-)